MLKATTLFLFLTIKSFALDFYTVNLPPYSFVNTEVSGPFKNIAEHICNSIKTGCTFQTAPWKRIMKNVKSGSYNACFVIGKNKLRDKWMYFTTPVTNTEYGFFVHSDLKTIPKSIDNLSSFNIIVHEKSNTARSLRKLKETKGYKFTIVEELDVDTAIKKFQNQRYTKDSILYGNKDIYEYILKERNFTKYKYIFKHKPIQYRFGFSKKSVSKDEFEAFNKALLELKSSGQIDKYFSK